METEGGLDHDKNACKVSYCSAIRSYDLKNLVLFQFLFIFIFCIRCSVEVETRGPHVRTRHQFRMLCVLWTHARRVMMHPEAYKHRQR